MKGNAEVTALLAQDAPGPRGTAPLTSSDESDVAAVTIEDAQRALLNILEDVAAERTSLELRHRAFLNILEDFEGEKSRLEATQRAMLNILQDFSGEKARLEVTERAALNILEDFAQEKTQLEAAQHAVVNILDDFWEEKGRLETAQRAMLNLLEDFDAEKAKAETINERLVREVHERRRIEEEVQNVNRELVATNSDLEAFTYSVAHDLRAPLRHIDGFAKIVLQEHAAGLEPQARSYLDRIVQGSRQMGLLVDDLLKLARVGRHGLNVQVTDLQALVQDVVAEARAESTGRRVDWRISPLPAAECDRGLMRQVFVNLLSNAAKFSRPREHAVVEVGSLRQDGGTVIYVRDNGVGFNMKHADKLFGVFQRLHRAEDFEGTGIGLAIVDRIVRRHGGRVWAEAEPDKGATFFLTVKSLGEGIEPSSGTESEQ